MTFPEREQQIIDLGTLRTTLSSDVKRCLQKLQEEKLSLEDEQFWGRTLTRSVFAMIEAIIYLMKQTALAIYYSEDTVKFSPAELCLITEKDYGLHHNGKVSPRNAKLTLRENICFAFRIFARAHSSNFQLKIGDESQEWENFQRAIQIRDRITHPKRLEHVTLSSEEITCIQKACIWFLKNFTEVTQIATKATEDRLEQFKRHSQYKDNFDTLRENLQTLFSQDISGIQNIENVRTVAKTSQEIGKSLVDYINFLLTVNDKSVNTIGELIIKVGRIMEEQIGALPSTLLDVSDNREEVNE